MRKLIGMCFNDTNYHLVWDESISQATDMGNYWASQASVDTVAHDVRTLFLNIMSRAGFGKAFPFKGHHDPQIKLAGNISYKEALQTILENSILIMILSTRFLAKKWLPRPLRRLHHACTAFQGYMTEIYSTEKAASTNPSEQNFMTSLVRASEQETGGGLKENEIYGNSKSHPC